VSVNKENEKMHSILAFTFGTPGWQELLIVGIIAVLLFGNRLPKVARSVGSSFIEFKRGVQGITDEANQITADLNDEAKQINESIRK